MMTAMRKRGKWLHRAALCLGGGTSLMLIDALVVWQKTFWLVMMILAMLLVSLALLMLLACLAGARKGLRFPEALRQMARSYGRGALMGALMAAVFAALTWLEPVLLPWQRWPWSWS